MVDCIINCGVKTHLKRNNESYCRTTIVTSLLQIEPAFIPAVMYTFLIEILCTHKISPTEKWKINHVRPALRYKWCESEHVDFQMVLPCAFNQSHSRSSITENKMFGGKKRLNCNICEGCVDVFSIALIFNRNVVEIIWLYFKWLKAFEGWKNILI